MGFLKKVGQAVFRAVPTRTIQTNYLEIFKFDENDNRIPVSDFEKNITWNIYSDRIETLDRFGIKMVLRTALNRGQSHIPHYLVFIVHPDDVKKAEFNVITITDKEITVGSIINDTLHIFSNR